MDREKKELSYNVVNDCLFPLADKLKRLLTPSISYEEPYEGWRISESHLRAACDEHHWDELLSYLRFNNNSHSAEELHSVLEESCQSLTKAHIAASALAVDIDPDENEVVICDYALQSLARFTTLIPRLVSQDNNKAIYPQNFNELENVLCDYLEGIETIDRLYKSLRSLGNNLGGVDSDHSFIPIAPVRDFDHMAYYHGRISEEHANDFARIVREMKSAADKLRQKLQSNDTDPIFSFCFCLENFWEMLLLIEKEKQSENLTAEEVLHLESTEENYRDLIRVFSNKLNEDADELVKNAIEQNKLVWKQIFAVYSQDWKGAIAQESRSPTSNKLHQLAAKKVNERQDRIDAARKGKERYDSYFAPYDAVWLDLINTPCNPVANKPLETDWLLERLSTLVVRARKLDNFDGTTKTLDWLRSLENSQVAKANDVAMGLALAIRLAIDGNLTRNEAAAFCHMLDKHPGNEIMQLRRGDNDDSKKITADGKSPLTQYVNLLIVVPEKLDRCIKRDAEAIRILSSDPALPEAISRADRWYWDRYREKQWGEIILSRRIWTRRDEKRLKMQRGLIGGWIPCCRVCRYLGWLEPRTGFSLHDQWFRKALQEAREDGQVSVLGEKLDKARQYYQEIISAARSIAQDDRGTNEFDTARSELGNLACELMDWTKKPATPSTKLPRSPNADSNADATTSEAPPGQSIEQLERTIPSLDKNNGEWAKSNDLKQHGETAAVGSLRTQRSRGRKTPAGTFGQCETGRIWRKTDEKSRSVWYYLPSLKK